MHALTSLKKQGASAPPHVKNSSTVTFGAVPNQIAVPTEGPRMSCGDGVTTNSQCVMIVVAAVVVLVHIQICHRFVMMMVSLLYTAEYDVHLFVISGEINIQYM